MTPFPGFPFPPTDPGPGERQVDPEEFDRPNHTDMPDNPPKTFSVNLGAIWRLLKGRKKWPTTKSPR